MLQWRSALQVREFNLLPTTQMSCGQVTAATRWFLQSGIQEQNGGVARYYRADLGKNTRISTEITGYAVSSLVYMYQRTGLEEALEGAIRSADFLIGDAWNSNLGIFPFEYPVNGDGPEPLAYFFDSGIIVRGLLALYRTTGRSEYRDAAIQGGESMGRYFRSVDAIHPILRLPSAEPLPYASQWSRSPGCYQLKSAMAWHDLAVLTGDSRFAGWYQKALSDAVATHQNFLPAETPEKTMDRLHAYLYFLEAVMPVSKRSEIGSILAEGIERVANYIIAIRPLFERSDVYAQLLRVRLFAAQEAGLPVNAEAARQEAGAIPGFQITGNAQPGHSGGYCFGRREGTLIPHMNPVSTAFCSQALEMWQDFQSGNRLSLESLI